MKVQIGGSMPLIPNSRALDLSGQNDPPTIVRLIIDGLHVRAVKWIIPASAPCLTSASRR